MSAETGAVVAVVPALDEERSVGHVVRRLRAAGISTVGRRSAFERTPKRGASTGTYVTRATAPHELWILPIAWAGLILATSSGRPWAVALLSAYVAGLGWMLAAHSAGRVVDLLRRSAIPLLGLASLATYGLLASRAPNTWLQEPRVFGVLGVVLAACYLVAAIVAIRRSPTRLELWTIVALGLAFRLVSLAHHPADDVSRYVVEGQQVLAGENPYLVAPADTAVGTADVRARVNHPDWTAIYPPGAVLIQAGIAALVPSPSGMRAAMLVAEILAQFAALALIRRRGLSTNLFLLSFWNPVGPLWTAAEGHNDALSALFLIGALFLLQLGHVHRSAATVTLAALCKPFAVVGLFPLGWSKRTALVIAAVGAGLVLPFIDAGPGLVSSILRFGGEMHFHAPLEPLLRGLSALWSGSPNRVLVLAGLLAGLLSWGAVFAWRLREDRARLTAWILGGVFLFAPTLHPWYFLPLVLLLPFARARWMVVWTGIAPLYWLHGLAIEAGGGEWVETAWVTALAHAPALLLLGIDGVRSIRVSMRRERSASASSGERPSVSVVIPVLNEARVIGSQLQRLRDVTGIAEIVVVDGGSTDTTCDRVLEHTDVRLLRSARGRGIQLNEGARVASGDVVLFLHADVRLPADAVDHISRALSDERIVAGAFRTRTVAERRSWVVPALRFADVRSWYSRLPYGDQAIFVRKDALRRIGGVPEQPLMEDLELSLRLRRLGKIRTVPAEVRVSGRRFLKRPILFTLLVNVFPVLYRSGVPAEVLSSYYPDVR